MPKDLSKDSYSATSIYMQLLPTLEQLKNAPLSREEKNENAMNIIMQALCKARTESVADKSDNSWHSISQNYIVNTRMNIARMNNIDEIIKYLNNAIAKGKNFTYAD